MAIISLNDGSVRWRVINLLTSGSIDVMATIDSMVNPIGSIIVFSANTGYPPGWLKCNGAEVSREEYPDLFQRIGTMYGAGDGETTFNVPDFRNKLIQGGEYAGVVSQLNISSGSGNISTMSTLVLIKGLNMTFDGQRFITGGGEVYKLATHEYDGLMSSQDKINLDMFYHQTNTHYEVGEVVHIPGLPSYVALECIEAGTTAEEAPDFS